MRSYAATAMRKHSLGLHRGCNTYVTHAGPDPCAQAKPAGGTPEWGWGLRGWDGPASTATGPRTLGSAGGVEQAELVPAMPPQLNHMYIVTQGEGRKVGLVI